jgi:glucosyl-dolichyl phosphate glucuronosyltransferase
VTTSANEAALVSVVVCTFRRPDYLTKALASLVEQSLPKARYEVIVVDNACDDDVRSMAAEYAKQATVLYVEEPKLGLSSARNTGMRCARGEYIAFIDDDGVASPLWLERVACAFGEGGPRLGCVGGPIEPIWEAPRPKWLVDRLLPVLTCLDRGGEARDLTDGEWLFGCNMVFRASALEEVGGFSTGLGRVGNNLLSNEEVLLQLNLSTRGYGRYYDPVALVRHHVPSDRLTPAWFLSRFYWQGVSEAITLRLAGGLGLPRRVKNAAFDAAALARSPGELGALVRTVFERQGTQKLEARCTALARLGLVKGWLSHLEPFDE